LARGKANEKKARRKNEAKRSPLKKQKKTKKENTVVTRSEETEWDPKKHAPG